MALKEESKFVKLLKDNQVRDFSHFTGYEIDPPLVLSSSGKKV
jgi:hypothetical protein